MNRTDKALLGVGAVAAAIAGMGVFGFTLAGALLTIALAAVWGAVVGAIRGWRG